MGTQRQPSVNVADLDTSVVLTVSQAAELAQVSPVTIRREIAAERLQARHIASCVRITRVAFDRSLNSDAEQPKTD